MFVDPIIMQFPENLDPERFVIATYYCATKPTTNMVKFAAALAIEQTCGTWLKVPGETEEDFAETLEVVEKVNFEQIFMFLYSRRKGTVADTMEGQVPEEIKHERFDKLKQLFEEKLTQNNASYIGKVEKVLVEGKSKNNENRYTGRTDSNKVVNFIASQDKVGKIVKVEITAEHIWYLEGKVI